MDYSLLFAIEKIPRQYRKPRNTIKSDYSLDGTSVLSGSSFNQTQYTKMSKFSTTQSVNSTQRHKYYSQCGKYIYHLAIIDYLQEYNLSKWGENFLKKNLLRRDGDLISAVIPSLYRNRFMKFMKEEAIIDTNLFDAEDSF